MWPWPWPWHTNLTLRRWRYTACANTNFPHQGFRKLSSDRQTNRHTHTYSQTDRTDTTKTITPTTQVVISGGNVNIAELNPFNLLYGFYTLKNADISSNLVNISRTCSQRNRVHACLNRWVLNPSVNCSWLMETLVFWGFTDQMTQPTVLKHWRKVLRIRLQSHQVHPTMLQ